MDFIAARQNMVDCQLETNQIYQPDILQAMSDIPRELFLPESKHHLAYMDEDIPLGQGRALLEPMVVGRMIQEVVPKKEEVVLDIGGATGYSAALFSNLVQTVVALESYQGFLEHAVKVWRQLDLCNIVDLHEDLFDGNQKNAPFDVIFINGAVCDVPVHLVSQLRAQTGRMICILRPNLQEHGQAVIIRSTSADHNGYSITPLFDASVPYLEDFKPKEGFSF